MRRGLTMIELLISLALLAVIVSATMSWTQLAGQFSSVATESQNNLRAAAAVLQLIHDDVVTGDFEVQPRAPRSPERVRVTDDQQLVITTRSRGVQSIHTYRFEASTSALALESQPGLEDQPASRVLTTGVVSFECNVDDEALMLFVTITLEDGAVLARRYAL